MDSTLPRALPRAGFPGQAQPHEPLATSPVCQPRHLQPRQRLSPGLPVAITFPSPPDADDRRLHTPGITSPARRLLPVDANKFLGSHLHLHALLSDAPKHSLRLATCIVRLQISSRAPPSLLPSPPHTGSPGACADPRPWVPAATTITPANSRPIRQRRRRAPPCLRAARRTGSA